MNKLIRSIISFVIVLLSLLFPVMLVNWLVQSRSGMATIDGGLGANTILAGLLADSLRAVLLIILYVKFNNARNLSSALVFGLLTSLLAGTLSVFYRYGASDQLGMNFLVEESAILLLQGILSGLALGFIYRR